MKTYMTQSKKLAKILTIGIIRIVTDEDFKKSESEREHPLVYGFFAFNNDEYDTVWQSIELGQFINNIYEWNFAQN